MWPCLLRQLLAACGDDSVGNTSVNVLWLAQRQKSALQRLDDKAPRVLGFHFLVQAGVVGSATPKCILEALHATFNSKQPPLHPDSFAQSITQIIINHPDNLPPRRFRLHMRFAADQRTVPLLEDKAFQGLSNRLQMIPEYLS